MGRPLYSEQPKNHPPGFFLEVNSSILTALWVALALEKHPEAAEDRHDPERTFELCKHVTWDDFWRAFPYMLRERGSYLDEIDALGLLLSSNANKQRFQRYFEEYARTSSNRPSSAAPINSPAQQHQRQSSTQHPGIRSNSQMPGQQRQQNSTTLPVRYRRQYQHHTLPHHQQQQQQQQNSNRQSQAVQVTLPAAAATARHPVAYVPPPPADRPLDAAAPATARRSTAAAGREQLSGRRRTWSEVCEEGPGPSATTTTVSTAQPQAVARLPEPSDNMQQRSLVPDVTNNSDMWRAVHDWLTSEDEALLVIVSRLVPYSYDGLLRPQAAVKQQLQQLADNRPVTNKVVSAISDRLSPTANNNLVCLIGNGPNRRAAAAAAVLACTDRAVYDISLAGLFKLEDIQSAILQGIFTEDHLRSRTPETPDTAPLAAAAAASDSTDVAEAAAVDPATAVGAAAAAAGTTPAELFAAVQERLRLNLRQHASMAQQTLRQVMVALREHRQEDAMRLMTQITAPAAAAFGALRSTVSPQIGVRIARLQTTLAEFGVLAAAGDFDEVIAAARALAQETEDCVAAFEAAARRAQHTAAADGTPAAAEEAGADDLAAGAAADGSRPEAHSSEQQPQPARDLAAQTNAERSAADTHPGPAYVQQLQSADQQQQQQQQWQDDFPDPSESDSEPEEGLDHLMETMHAGFGGFDFTQRRARTIRVQRPSAMARRVLDEHIRQILQSRAANASDGHDEDHDDPSEGSEGGSDEDVGGQGFGPFRFLNPAGPNADPSASRHNRQLLAPVVNPAGHVAGRNGCAERFRCSEQFSAMLTLLGTCGKQPMLLLLDEADSALIAEDGDGFRQLLLRIVSMLPQAVVVVMSSFKAAAFSQSSVLLRQSVRDVRYEVSDGWLDIACYRVPKTLYYRCFM